MSLKAVSFDYSGLLFLSISRQICLELFKRNTLRHKRLDRYPSQSSPDTETLIQISRELDSVVVQLSNRVTETKNSKSSLTNHDMYTCTVSLHTCIYQTFDVRNGVKFDSCLENFGFFYFCH